MWRSSSACASHDDDVFDQQVLLQWSGLVQYFVRSISCDAGREEVETIPGNY
jgi:hypothetical protein